MRKILGGILLCSVLFTSVFASSREELAANFLASKWVITDKSSNPSEYRLSDTITRKETMKIVAKLAGATVTEKCDGKFTDVVNDWGCKYIEWALSVWFISAGNGTFRPDDNITKTEAMKLIFKARNIAKIYTTDNWQKDYADTAYDLGIVSSKYSDYNSDAKRGWIFESVYNTYSPLERSTYSSEQ